MDSTVTKRLPAVLFAFTEDWYFWSHRKPLADYLRERDCIVSLATHFNRHKSKLAEAGIHCIPVSFERSLRHPLRDLRAVFGLWAAVRQARPDIVHLVSLKPILLSGLAVFTKPKTRFVAAFTGMGYLFSSNDRSARWFRRCVIAILRVILGRANVWIIVQNVEDQVLLSSEGLGVSQRTVLIPGAGVNSEEFKFSELPTNDPAIVLLPARLIRDKGIEEFVEAARYCKRIDASTRFVLVGGYDPDNPAAIPQSVIDGWETEGVIERWGHCRDMAPVYTQSRIVCLPSYREGLPKVLLEAAACGRPIIATDVPGCRDVCRDGVTGILIPAHSSAALGTAITKMLAAPDMQRAYGAAGRELVEREFTIEHIGRQTLDFYERLLGAPGSN